MASRESAKPGATTRAVRPLRIVLAWREGNRSTQELFEIVIKKYAENSTVLTFHEGEKAWAELSRTDPDLLVIRWRSGYDSQLLQRLGERKVKYPIVVVKTYLSAELAEKIRAEGPNLNITMLEMTDGMIDVFLEVLEAVKRTQKEPSDYQGSEASPLGERAASGKLNVPAAAAPNDASAANMKSTKPIPNILTVYECSSPAKHRIFRRAEADGSCGNCGKPFVKVASVPREAGEDDLHFQLRALRTKDARVH